MDLRRYELATVAAARRLRSTYCTLAHGSVLIDKFLDAEAIAAVVQDHRNAGLTPTEVAVMDLAEKVVEDATATDRSDIERVRSLGLSDEEIVDVVLAAAARCFFSKTLDALGVEAGAKYAERDPAIRARESARRDEFSGLISSTVNEVHLLPQPPRRHESGAPSVL